MRHALIGLALWCTAALGATGARAQDRTVILVRHAERAPEPRADPPLTEAGRARAGALADAVTGRVDVVIVTPYRRTRETAAPIARIRGLTPVEVSPAGGLAAHAREVADSILAGAPGRTVLVVGHSNTLPAIIAALGGPTVPDLCETEYATLFVLTLPAAGPPRLTRAVYGAPDPPGADGCRAAPPGMLETRPPMPDSTPYGRLNPKAPPELARFAFLVGRWRCDVRITPPGSAELRFRGEWTGRYVLDGYAIVEEYRQWDSAGTLVQLGQNIRSYDAARRRWVIRWLDALAGTWLELAPPDLGDVVMTETSITYYHHLPEGPAAALFPANTIFRVSYENISLRHFTWRAAASRDSGKTWEVVQQIEAERAEP